MYIYIHKYIVSTSYMCIYAYVYLLLDECINTAPSTAHPTAQGFGGQGTSPQPCRATRLRRGPRVVAAWGGAL